MTGDAARPHRIGQHRGVTDAASDEHVRRRVHPGVLAIVIALLAMWGYVVYLAFFVGRGDSPDKIDEPAFIEAAEARCAEALDFVDTLPRADVQATDPAGRADTIVTATDAFEVMVADLGVLADEQIVDPDSAGLVGLWLDDWEAFVADRFDYAERLRTDPDARLLVTPGLNGRQITLQIDEFAATNEMPSCKSPLDA